MIAILIAVMLCLSVLQGSYSDRMVALIFSVPYAVCFGVSEYIPGSVYFHVEAIMGLVSIFILLRFKTKLAHILAVASFFSIVINFFGWILWVNYKCPAPYVTLFAIYYLVIMLILGSRGSLVRYHGLCSWFCDDGGDRMATDKGGKA